MAKRPVFIPASEDDRFVRERSFEFSWNSGFAAIQKKKNIEALHTAAAESGIAPLLEISTKSDEKLGIRLSAFNLKVETDDFGEIPLECAFQGSKIFEHGGPYTDLYRVESQAARKDSRIRESGSLISFNFEGLEFPLEPKTGFYDWLYIRAIYPHREYLQRLDKYAGFTDIEFNPAKSINCQARSCATFVAMQRKGVLDESIRSASNFLAALSPDARHQPHSRDDVQGKLF